MTDRGIAQTSLVIVAILCAVGLLLPVMVAGFSTDPPAKNRVIIVVGKSPQRLCFEQVSDIAVVGDVITLTTPDGPAVFSLTYFFIVSVGEADAETGRAFCAAVIGPRVPAVQDLGT